MPLNALLVKIIIAVLIGMNVPLITCLKLELQEPQNNSSHLFDIPNHLEEDEFMDEYGKFMKASMNESVGPCEDFYEYACGNWTSDEMIPSGLRNKSLLGAMNVKVQELMESYLKNSTEEDLKGLTAEGKAKLFFKTCLDDRKDMPKGFKFLWDRLDKEGQSINSTYTWIQVNFISKYGVEPFLPLKLHYNRESRKFELLLKAPSKILDNKILVDFKNITRDLKWGEDDNLVQNLTKQFEEMKNFESDLISYSTKRNATEVLSLKRFYDVHKEDRVNWTLYFHQAFNGSAKEEWIIHNTVEDFGNLAKFLKKQKPQQLYKYIKWVTLIKFYFIWKLELTNRTEAAVCREHTQEYFKYSLMPWFIETTFDANRRDDILHIAKPIRQMFYELIEKQKWLDETTKSNAKSKLRSMEIEVGYTDDMKEKDTINHAYRLYNLTGDWFENLLLLEDRRSTSRLKIPNMAYVPWLTPHDSNAYYASFLNMVYVAIGLSQSPLYHLKLPPSMKFGGIGNIIGHEMAHGFDAQNFKYNYDGKSQSWWSNSSLMNFRERYRCLESQYNRYIYFGVQTNGSHTLSDNIADNVGARLAYNAYMDLYGKSDGHKKPFIGLKFSNKQLFFIKFAQNWCTGKSTSALLSKIKSSDEHALEQFRVVGTLVNMPEFSETFKCKLGSGMNPLKKCFIWV